jgi:hypothetical protein
MLGLKRVVASLLAVYAAGVVLFSAMYWRVWHDEELYEALLDVAPPETRLNLLAYPVRTVGAMVLAWPFWVLVERFGADE